jgi:hypothetical protein
MFVEVFRCTCELEGMSLKGLWYFKVVTQLQIRGNNYLYSYFSIFYRYFSAAITCYRRYRQLQIFNTALQFKP